VRPDSQRGFAHACTGALVRVNHFDAELILLYILSNFDFYGNFARITWLCTMASIGNYYARLFLASLICAFALVQDSMEAVVASMLISPVGEPLYLIAPAALSGNIPILMGAIGTLVVSTAAMLGVGASVRAWEGGGPRNLTREMSKRTTKFSKRDVFIYALLIGAASTTTLPSLGLTSATAALFATGLAVAISILPPIVNAGALLYDALTETGRVRSMRAGARPALIKSTRPFAPARTSFLLACINMAGVIIASAATKAATARLR